MFGLFTKKAPVRPESDEPVSPIMMMGGHPVRLLSPGASVAADVAIRKVPQLYRITNFVASAVQVVPWYCEPDPTLPSSERAGAKPVKAVNDLLRAPNDTFTAQQLQYWLAINLMLYARAHFKVGVGMGGTPNGMYPLAAKYMSATLNNRGTVETYHYGTGESKSSFPTRRVAEKRGGNQSYAAEISFPSLSGLVEYNKAPAAVESIAQPIQIIIALMQRALDMASGHPNIKYVITAEKTLTKAQRDALEEHLAQSTPGEENSGTVLFLYNTVIQLHKLDNDLKDIHSKLPLDDMTRQIAGAFGVPIALLGLGSADAAKFASNYQESRLSFWQDTVVPCYLSPISSGMTQALCPPGARIQFDLDAVPALWEGRAAIGEKLTKVNFLRANEKREILSFQPDNSIPDAGYPIPAPDPNEVPSLPPPNAEPELPDKPELENNTSNSKIVAIHGSKAT